MKKWHITTRESIDKIANDAMTKALDHIYTVLGVDVSKAISDIEIENLSNAIWEQIPTENKQI